jgi:hypothetical protein
MSAATGRASSRPYVFPAKYPLDYGTLTMPSSVAVLSDTDDPAGVSVAASPSGPGELLITDVQIDNSVITTTVSGGQPGRIYALKFLVPMFNGFVREVIASLTVARELITDQPLPPSSMDWGPPVSQTSRSLKSSHTGTMGTTPAIIVPYSATRSWLLVSNRSATYEMQDIGPADVTVGGGIPLAAGAGFLFQGSEAVGPIYGVTTAPNSAYSWVEA